MMASSGQIHADLLLSGGLGLRPLTVASVLPDHLQILVKGDTLERQLLLASC